LVAVALGEGTKVAVGTTVAVGKAVAVGDGVGVGAAQAARVAADNISQVTLCNRAIFIEASGPAV
jgi:hypothetical protein